MMEFTARVAMVGVPDKNGIAFSQEALEAVALKQAKILGHLGPKQVQFEASGTSEIQLDGSIRIRNFSIHSINVVIK